jgi:hypothetical protein
MTFAFVRDAPTPWRVSRGLLALYRSWDAIVVVPEPEPVGTGAPDEDHYFVATSCEVGGSAPAQHASTAGQDDFHRGVPDREAPGWAQNRHGVG